MSSTPSTARAKRTRTPRTRSNSATNGAPRAQAPSIPAVSAEQRHALIAESAYRRAERRGFTGGDAVADWLDSEREVDALLTSSAD